MNNTEECEITFGDHDINTVEQINNVSINVEPYDIGPSEVWRDFQDLVDSMVCPVCHQIERLRQKPDYRIFIPLGTPPELAKELDEHLKEINYDDYVEQMERRWKETYEVTSTIDNRIKELEADSGHTCRKRGRDDDVKRCFDE